jgi:hypothetical protein
MRLLTGREGTAAPIAGGRRVMGTGFGFFLIGAGAVLLFAVHTGSWAGLDLHVVGVIVLTVGVVWLLLLPARRTAPTPDRLRRWINPSGINDPGVRDFRSAATIVAEQIREDKESFRPDGAARQQDEL